MLPYFHLQLLSSQTSFSFYKMEKVFNVFQFFLYKLKGIFWKVFKKLKVFPFYWLFMRMQVCDFSKSWKFSMNKQKNCKGNSPWRESYLKIALLPTPREQTVKIKEEKKTKQIIQFSFRTHASKLIKQSFNQQKVGQEQRPSNWWTNLL